MFRNSKLFKRIVSGMAAAVMLATNALPFVPAPILASAEAAHTINVFDISLSGGAIYYDSFKDDDAKETTAELTDAYVWTADKSNKGHKFIYNIKFSMSGEGTTNDPSESNNTKEAVSADFVEIKIPAHILRDKSGDYADSIELPVPHKDEIETRLDENDKKVYVTDHEFVYKTVTEGGTEYIVIYNIQPISAGSVYEFPVAYKMLEPTWDYEDLDAQEAPVATATVKSWEQNDQNATQTDATKITSTSTAEPVHINTAAVLNSTSKKVYSDASTGDVLLTAEQLSRATSGLDVTDTGYKYVLWTVSSAIPAVTQKYDFTLTDTPKPIEGTGADGIQHSISGEVYAIKHGNTWVYNSNTFTETGLTSSGTRTDYVVTKYSASDLAAIETAAAMPGIYTGINDVVATVTPADGKDKETPRDSEAFFSYEAKDPTFEPAVEGYDVKKYGLYNGNNIVRSNANVTNYGMGDIVDGTADELSGIRYQTNSYAYAYPRTITDVNVVLNSLKPSETTSNGNKTYTVQSLTEDGNVISSYVWSGAEPGSYKITTGADTETVALATDPSTLLEFQKIVGQHIAENYYGKENVTYTFDDKQIKFVNAQTPSVEYDDLGSDDYYIKRVEYNYTASAAEYGADKMRFSASPVTDFSKNDILDFYVYKDGAAERKLAAQYRLSDGKATMIDDCVSSLTSAEIAFKASSNITGYAVEASNKYYYVSLVTYPEVVLKNSDAVKTRFSDVRASGLKKLGVKNTGTWTVKAHNGETLYIDHVSGTDYIAEVTRKSTIRKAALDEDTRITGKDGNAYKTGNDSLNRQYTVAWRTEVYEETDDGTRVPQQSGIFYDLLPEHSEIIRDSINVNIDGTAVPSAISYIKTIEKYNGSNQTLLVIKVDAECQKNYVLTYATSHSYENIQDYGNMALNTVVYRTGNANLGGSYADDGGNHAVTNADIMTGLATNPKSSDSALGFTPEYDGTAKKFIYAEATEQMLALIQTSSGIYKKVSTVSDPTYRKSGTVSINEDYKYNIRMKNSASTKARDIAILDSIENFMTGYNYGTKTKGWGGTIQSIDLSGVQAKMDTFFKSYTFPAGISDTEKAASKDVKLMLYVSDDKDDIVDLEGSLYSDATDRQALLKYLLGETDSASDTKTAGKWKVIDNLSDLTNGGTIDLDKVTAFIVYTGKHFTLGKGESLSFNVTMTAPEQDVNNYDGVTGYITKPKTYNNVYRSFTNVPVKTVEKKDEDGNPVLDKNGKPVTEEVDDAGTYFYTHYDNTELELATVGTLEFSKVDSDTGNALAGVTFSLSGISAYGTAYDETLVSDAIGKVVFEGLEIGTYKLVETLPDENHMPDPTERTVVVSRTGDVTVYKIYDSADREKCEEADKDGSGKYIIENVPRYHGDISFLKRDSKTGYGARGALFRFTGTSLLGTNYDRTAESNLNGTVTFTDIEPGTYELTEIRSPDNYEPNTVKYTVTVKEGSNYGISYTISGDGAGKISGTPYINNAPTGKLTIHKADSFTKEELDGAKFRLTAPSALNNDIETLVKGLTEQYKAQYLLKNPDADENSIPQEKIDGYVKWKWDSANSVWYQTYTSLSSDAFFEGEFNFGYLLAGSGYTLTEIAAPSGHEITGSPYTFDVAWDSSNNIFDIDFDDTTNLEYVKMGEKTYETTDSYADSLYVRVNNTPTYEDGKVIYKSWIGDPYTTGFPKVHLGAEVTAQPKVYVTIKSSNSQNLSNSFRQVTFANRAQYTAFTRATFDEYTAASIAGKVNDITENDPTGVETGHFYIWEEQVGDELQIKWYTDADVVYLPPVCENMFYQWGFKTLDLSYETTGVEFSAKKVKTTAGMFSGCSNLETVDLTCFKETPQLTSTKSMFSNYSNGGNCPNLTTVNMSNWSDAKNLKSMEFMFSGCTNLKEYLVPKLKVDALEQCNHMFMECKNLEKVVLGEHIKLNSTRSGNGLMSMFYNAGKNGDGFVIDISGLDTTGINDGAWHIGHMFRDSSKLTTVYVSDKWDNSKFATNDQNQTFGGTGNLVGGKGSKSLGSSVAVAKIDGGTSNPGYFTDINDLKTQLEANGGTLEAWRSRSTVATSGTQSLNSSSKQRGLSLKAVGSATIDTSGNYTKGFDEAAVTDSVSGAGFGVDTSQSFEPTTTEITKDEGANYLPIVNYSYEYITAKGGAITGGSTSYSVDETINLTVTVTTYTDSATQGKMTEKVSKYFYTKTIPNGATWTEVSTESGSQWKLTMSVNDADKEFFMWEDDIAGYTSDAAASAQRKTEGRDDEPVIGNTQSGQKVGSISITKALSGTTSNKYDADKFWVKVTVTTDGAAPYTKKPFNASGEAYYQIEAGETVTISSIPEGYHYEVVECSDAEHPMPKGYAENEIGFSSSDKKISSTAVGKVTVTNDILKQDISISKTAVLNVVDASGNAYTGDKTAEETAFAAESYTFNVTFTGLVMGETYNYKIYQTSENPESVVNSSSFTASPDSDETSVSVDLKNNQKVVFENIPQQAKYTVTETEPAAGDTNTTYSAEYSVNNAQSLNGYSTDEQTLDDTADIIAFTNTKRVVKDDSKISITIKKNWYDTDGLTPLAADDSAMPSFINVYLGRVLKYEVKGVTYYTDQLDSYKMAVLNSSGNWEVTYDNLPKTAKVKAGTQNGIPVEYQGTYVYYVSESSMFLFENSQEKEDQPAVTLGDNKYYFVKNETDPKAYTYTLNNQKKEIEEFTVSKTVSGNFGNKTRNFGFTLWLYDESGEPVTNVTGVRATFKVNGVVSRNRTYTLTSSNSIDFSLSHNESVTFYLPDKTRYTISETDYTSEGYVTSYKVNNGLSIDGTTYSATLSKNSPTTVAYTNTKEGTVPTGIRTTAYAAAFAALSAAVYLNLKKRKRDKEEDS